MSSAGGFVRHRETKVIVIHLCFQDISETLSTQPGGYYKFPGYFSYFLPARQAIPLYKHNKNILNTGWMVQSFFRFPGTQYIRIMIEYKILSYGYYLISGKARIHSAIY